MSSYVESDFGSISSFDEEYRYYRVAGFSHFEALNKARDYYRKHLRREVLESDTFKLDMIAEEESVSKDQLIDFNAVIARVLNTEYTKQEARKYGKKEKLVRLIFLVVRMEGLDYLLSEENLERSYSEIGDVQVSTMAEIAVAMGYKLKSNGCSNTLTELKYGLQHLMRDNGSVIVENGHHAFA